MVRLSRVNGDTVNAEPEKTTSPVNPSVCRANKSSTLKRARCKREGFTS